MEIVLLIARVAFGLGLAGHGVQKLFGWFGGYGLTATSAGFESIGFRPGRLFATAAALGETAGGVLTALGLLSPIGPALMLLVMIVAMSTHIKQGFFVTKQGIELPMMYALAGLLLAFTGPGSYSLDRLIAWQPTSRLASISVVIAVVLAVVNIGARRAPAQTQTAA